MLCQCRCAKTRLVKWYRSFQKHNDVIKQSGDNVIILTGLAVIVRSVFSIIIYLSVFSSSPVSGNVISTRVLKFLVPASTVPQEAVLRGISWLCVDKMPMSMQVEGAEAGVCGLVGWNCWFFFKALNPTCSLEEM